MAPGGCFGVLRTGQVSVGIPPVDTTIPISVPAGAENSSVAIWWPEQPYIGHMKTWLTVKNPSGGLVGMMRAADIGRASIERMGRLLVLLGTLACGGSVSDSTRLEPADQAAESEADRDRAGDDNATGRAGRPNGGSESMAHAAPDSEPEMVTNAGSCSDEAAGEARLRQVGIPPDVIPIGPTITVRVSVLMEAGAPLVCVRDLLQDAEVSGEVAEGGRIRLHGLTELGILPSIASQPGVLRIDTRFLVDDGTGLF